ncbi:MAG: hypothetical protein LBU23_03470 [Planctomycetota bacterium]|jgi:nickel transport protein|nr:hypothetical protein [Planctomycetota bacterium]
MRRFPSLLAALAAFMSLSGQCLAHRVNVFAFVDGDEIQVECGFSRSQKVKNGKLVISDLETGDTLLEGATDDQGRFRFRPSDEFLSIGHGLNIRLYAGEGHQDDWKIAPEELRALSRTGGVGASAPAKAGAAAARQTVPSSGENRTASLSGIDLAELEASIGKIMDAKLSPIKQDLARQRNGEPGLRDIVGGIGWILGLLGLAAYMKHRR